jgi:hypothetical protein
MVTVENADCGRPAGAISICSPELGAKLLANGSHQIADEQAVADYKADQERKGKLLGAGARAWARANREPNQKEGIRYAV